MDKKSVLLTTIGNNIKEGKKYQVIKLFTMVLTLFYTISCNSNQFFLTKKTTDCILLYYCGIRCFGFKNWRYLFCRKNCR